MAYLDDLLSFLGDSEDETQQPDVDPNADLIRPLSKRERFAPKVSPAARSKFLKEEVPEQTDWYNRIASGVVGDIRDLYTGVSTLAGLPFTTAGRETLGRGVRAVTQRPLETAATLGKALVEPYTPQEGEGVTGVIKRRLLDHPLATAMDVAGLVGGAGLATKGVGALARMPEVYKAGEAIAHAATYVDPVSQAMNAGGMLGKTLSPGLARKMEMRAALKELTQANALKAEFVGSRKAAEIKAMMKEMTPTEAALFHPWSQGRIPTPPDVASDFTERMQYFGEKWEGIHHDYEVALGLDPETHAADAVRQAWNNNEARWAGDSEAARAELEQIHAGALQTATEQQQYRRTLPGRNAVYDAKAKQWNDAAMKTKAENLAAGVASDAEWLRPIPDEAPDMKMWNAIPVDEIAQSFEVGQGRIYLPDSAEVLTHDQATVSNLLGKVREALPWKFNKGALARTGMLDRLSPIEKVQELEQKLGDVVANGNSKAADALRAELEATKEPLTTALLGMNKKLASYTTRTNIYEGLGELAVEKGWGEKLSPSKSVMTDISVTGDSAKGIEATHQLLWPNGRMKMYAMSHELEPLLKGLLEHADHPIVKDLNIIDTITKATGAMDKTVGVAQGSVYKIPKDMGDLIAGFHDMYQPSNSAVLRGWDKVSDVWRYTTLNLRPAWVTNNLVGNVVFNAMYGMHPFNPAAYNTYFQAFKALGAKRKGWFGEEGQKLAKVFDLPGISQGGLYGSEGVAKTTAGQVGSGIGASLGGSASRAVRALGAPGEMIASFNQGLEGWFRAAATIHGLKRAHFVEMARSGQSILKAMDVGEKLKSLSEMGADALVREKDFRSALAFTNKALNDYANQGPLQRNVLRRVMPFQNFYGHALRVATSYPFDRAASATMVRSLAGVAKQDLKDQVESWGLDWDKDVPEQYKDSIPVDVITGPDGSKQMRMLNTRGPNPMSIMTQDDPGADALGNLNPILRVAIESITGADLFAMDKTAGPLTTFAGKEFDPKSGKMVEGKTRKMPVENFLQQFWPYRATEETLAGGRSKYPTTTLIDQLFNEQAAYRTDPRTGQPITKPKLPSTGFRAGVERAAPFIRNLIPVPQVVAPRTKEQKQKEQQGESEVLNKLWRRASPEEKVKIRERLRRAQYEG